MVDFRLARCKAHVYVLESVERSKKAYNMETITIVMEVGFMTTFVGIGAIGAVYLNLVVCAKHYLAQGVELAGS